VVDLWLFYFFAALTVTASLLVIARRNPMHSVLLLIVSFIGLAGLYVLLDSPFAAVTQIIVYAGAIMVLFLFVVMLLNAPREDTPAYDPRWPALAAGWRRAGAVLALVFLGQVLWAMTRVSRQSFDTSDQAGQMVSSVRTIGVELFTTHAFAFEVTSVLILVAMVGAVALAKRNL
jgi:NADH-quinone oxidoreductase subunit J